MLHIHACMRIANTTLACCAASQTPVMVRAAGGELGLQIPAFQMHKN